MPALIADLGEAKRLLELDERLRLVPTSAASRGVFFNLARSALVEDGLGRVLDTQQEIFEPRKSFSLHPVRELLTVYATAGALLRADPLEGVARIARGGSSFYAGSWLGNRFRKLIMPDPYVALSWIERSRDHLCNYGFWRLERRGPRHLVLHMFTEYVWINPWQRGGCEGLLKRCGVDGAVDVELDNRFNGLLDIRWD